MRTAGRSEGMAPQARGHGWPQSSQRRSGSRHPGCRRFLPRVTPSDRDGQRLRVPPGSASTVAVGPRYLLPNQVSCFRLPARNCEARSSRPLVNRDGRECADGPAACRLGRYPVDRQASPDVRVSAPRVRRVGHADSVPAVHWVLSQSTGSGTVGTLLVIPVQRGGGASGRLASPDREPEYGYNLGVLNAPRPRL